MRSIFNGKLMVVGCSVANNSYKEVSMVIMSCTSNNLSFWARNPWLSNASIARFKDSKCTTKKRKYEWIKCTIENFCSYYGSTLYFELCTIIILKLFSWIFNLSKYSLQFQKAMPYFWATLLKSFLTALSSAKKLRRYLNLQLEKCQLTIQFFLNSPQLQRRSVCWKMNFVQIRKRIHNLRHFGVIPVGGFAIVTEKLIKNILYLIEKWERNQICRLYAYLM